MDVEYYTQHHYDGSPLLEVDFQVQAELGRAEDNFIAGVKHATMQLQITAASFLLTLKEKYKVDVCYRIWWTNSYCAPTDQPICCGLCCGGCYKFNTAKFSRV